MTILSREHDFGWGMVIGLVMGAIFAAGYVASRNERPPAGRFQAINVSGRVYVLNTTTGTLSHVVNGKVYSVPWVVAGDPELDPDGAFDMPTMDPAESIRQSREQPWDEEERDEPPAVRRR